MKVGQILGATDKTGGSARNRPVRYLDVLATVYRNLGINPHGFYYDKSGRPTMVLPGTARVIQELV